MIEENKINEIVNKIVLGYQPDKIILFGSYAVGNATEHSDLDLLVVKNSSDPRPHRSAQVRKMLFGMQVPIDILVYTPDEIDNSKEDKYSFIYQILSTGKTLYDQAD